MTDIAQVERVNRLLISYGDVLTPLQKDVLSCYYSYNLSISEIANERNVSRAAVEDALKKGVNKLEEFEEKLNINKKREKILKITANIKQKLNSNDEITAEIEEIERILTDGI